LFATSENVDQPTASAEPLQAEGVSDLWISSQTNTFDFSVVLFRPHFMLASEEHLMKMQKNQWLFTFCLTLISLGEP
jgi:hypothetical protein